MDGERFQWPETQVEGLTEEHQSVFNSHMQIKKFQQRAVVGDASVRAFSVGNKWGSMLINEKLIPVLTRGHVEEGTVAPVTPGAVQGSLPGEASRPIRGTEGEDLGEAREVVRSFVAPGAVKEEKEQGQAIFIVGACVAGLVIYNIV